MAAAAMLSSPFLAGARAAGPRPGAGAWRGATVGNGHRTVMKAGNWLPGSDTPSYLENVPGCAAGARLRPPPLGRVRARCWAALNGAGAGAAGRTASTPWASAPCRTTCSDSRSRSLCTAAGPWRA